MTIYYSRKEIFEDFLFTWQRKGIAGPDVLDVGANEGSLHKELKSIFYEVDGIDICNSNDKNIMLIDLNKPFKIKKKYDLIVMGEIIEHLDNPFEVIKKLKKCLNPEGCIIITTPNARTLDFNWNQLRTHPEHIYCWDRTLLDRFMQRLGFLWCESGYVSSYKTKIIMQFIPNKSWHIYGVYQKGD